MSKRLSESDRAVVSLLSISSVSLSLSLSHSLHTSLVCNYQVFESKRLSESDRAVASLLSISSDFLFTAKIRPPSHDDKSQTVSIAKRFWTSLILRAMLEERPWEVGE